MKTLAVSLVLIAIAGVAKTPLDTAKKLAATKFDGWTYGSSASKKQVDCVQFVLAVLEKETKRTLKKDVRLAVLINYKFKDLSKSVEKNDAKTKGIQRAVVDILKLGKVVEPKKAQAGDFIQYWMKKKDGTWFGHSAIISKVSKSRNGTPQAILYGAHKSLGKIGDSIFKLNLTGKDRKIYLCRLK